MLHKDRGSILLVSVIVFSIIATISMSCVGLILSNNRIYNLEYINEKIKEGNIGLIEIVRSNILKEVKMAVENTKNESEFYSYITKNQSREFIRKIEDVSNSSLSNSQIKITYNTTATTKKYIHYTISTKYIIENHDKHIVAKVKIKNPWSEVKIDNKEINDDDIIHDDEDEEIESSNINESDLVIFYNYEEK